MRLSLKVFAQNPSAERIAMYIYDSIVELAKKDGINLLKEFSEKNGGLAYLKSVDVFETDTSRARYTV